MEVDDLLEDVFRPPGLPFRDAWGSQGQRTKKMSSTQVPTSEEMSVDIYGDLSTDTLHCEDTLSETCRDETVRFFHMLPSKKSHLEADGNASSLDLYTETLASDLTDKDMMERKLRQLELSHSKLLEENKILMVSKEQLCKNISSLFMTARKELQQKDEELAKLRTIAAEHEKCKDLLSSNEDRKFSRTWRSEQHHALPYHRTSSNTRMSVGSKEDSNKAVSQSHRKRSESHRHGRQKDIQSSDWHTEREDGQNHYSSFRSEPDKYISSRPASDKKDAVKTESKKVDRGLRRESDGKDSRRHQHQSRSPVLPRPAHTEGQDHDRSFSKSFDLRSKLNRKVHVETDGVDQTSSSFNSKNQLVSTVICSNKAPSAFENSGLNVMTKLGNSQSDKLKPTSLSYHTVTSQTASETLIICEQSTLQCSSDSDRLRQEVDLPPHSVSTVQSVDSHRTSKHSPVHTSQTPKHVKDLSEMHSAQHDVAMLAGPQQDSNSLEGPSHADSASLPQQTVSPASNAKKVIENTEVFSKLKQQSMPREDLADMSKSPESEVPIKLTHKTPELDVSISLKQSDIEHLNRDTMSPDETCNPATPKDMGKKSSAKYQSPSNDMAPDGSTVSSDGTVTPEEASSVLERMKLMTSPILNKTSNVGTTEFNLDVPPSHDSSSTLSPSSLPFTNLKDSHEFSRSNSGENDANATNHTEAFDIQRINVSPDTGSSMDNSLKSVLHSKASLEDLEGRKQPLESTTEKRSFHIPKTDKASLDSQSLDPVSQQADNELETMDKSSYSNSNSNSAGGSDGQTEDTNAQIQQSTSSVSSSLESVEINNLKQIGASRGKSTDTARSSPLVTNVICTSNLIMLGDEEASCSNFPSPCKPHLIPSEFYPPGVRGQVSEDVSHFRHIRGKPEVVQRISKTQPIVQATATTRQTDEHREDKPMYHEKAIEELKIYKSTPTDHPAISKIAALSDTDPQHLAQVDGKQFEKSTNTATQKELAKIVDGDDGSRPHSRTQKSHEGQTEWRPIVEKQFESLLNTTFCKFKEDMSRNAPLGKKKLQKNLKSSDLYKELKGRVNSQCSQVRDKTTEMIKGSQNDTNDTLSSSSNLGGTKINSSHISRNDNSQKPTYKFIFNSIMSGTCAGSERKFPISDLQTRKDFKDSSCRTEISRNNETRVKCLFKNNQGEVLDQIKSPLNENIDPSTHNICRSSFQDGSKHLSYPSAPHTDRQHTDKTHYRKSLAQVGEVFLSQKDTKDGHFIGKDGRHASDLHDSNRQVSPWSCVKSVCNDKPASDCSPLKHGPSTSLVMMKWRASPDSCMVTSSDHNGECHNHHLPTSRDQQVVSGMSQMSHHLEPDSTSDPLSGDRENSENTSDEVDCSATSNGRKSSDWFGRASPKSALNSQFKTLHSQKAITPTNSPNFKNKLNLKPSPIKTVDASLRDQLYLSDDDEENGGNRQFVFAEKNRSNEYQSRLTGKIIPTQDDVHRELRPSKHVEDKNTRVTATHDNYSLQQELNTTFLVSDDNRLSVISHPDVGTDGGERSRTPSRRSPIFASEEISLMNASLSEFDSDVHSCRKHKSEMEAQSPKFYSGMFSQPGTCNPECIKGSENDMLNFRKEMDTETLKNSNCNSKETVNVQDGTRKGQYSKNSGDGECAPVPTGKAVKSEKSKPSRKTSRHLSLSELLDQNLVKRNYSCERSSRGAPPQDDQEMSKWSESRLSTSNLGTKITADEDPKLFSAQQEDYMQNVQRVKRDLKNDFRNESQVNLVHNPFASPVINVSDIILSPSDMRGENGADLEAGRPSDQDNLFSVKANVVTALANVPSKSKTAKSKVTHSSSGLCEDISSKKFNSMHGSTKMASKRQHMGSLSVEDDADSHGNVDNHMKPLSSLNSNQKSSSDYEVVSGCLGTTSTCERYAHSTNDSDFEDGEIVDEDSFLEDSGEGTCTNNRHKGDTGPGRCEITADSSSVLRTTNSDVDLRQKLTRRRNSRSKKSVSSKYLNESNLEKESLDMLGKSKAAESSSPLDRIYNHTPVSYTHYVHVPSESIFSDNPTETWSRKRRRSSTDDDKLLSRSERTRHTRKDVGHCEASVAKRSHEHGTKDQTKTWNKVDEGEVGRHFGDRRGANCRVGRSDSQSRDSHRKKPLNKNQQRRPDWKFGKEKKSKGDLGCHESTMVPGDGWKRRDKNAPLEKRQRYETNEPNYCRDVKGDGKSSVSVSQDRHQVDRSCSRSERSSFSASCQGAGKELYGSRRHEHDGHHKTTSHTHSPNLRSTSSHERSPVRWRRKKL